MATRKSRIYFFVWSAVSGLLAMSTPAYAIQGDLGAGPIRMRVTPCLIAKASGSAPCPEPAIPATDDRKAVTDAVLARAWFFVDLQQLDVAASEITAALAADAQNVQLLHMSARLARTVGDVQRAEKDVDLALQQTPNDLDLQATKAELLETRAAPAEALRDFNEILAKRPTHLFARFRRAQLLLQSGNPLRALVDLDYLASGDEPDLIFLATRAEANLAVDRPARAVRDFSAALALDPGNFSLLQRRALAHEYNDDDDAALADYDILLGPVGENPNYAIDGDMLANLLRRRASLLVRNGRRDDAAADAIAAIAGGGKSTILKTQVFLRRHGFSDTRIDGRISDELRKTVRLCYALDACFRAMSEPL